MSIGSSIASTKKIELSQSKLDRFSTTYTMIVIQSPRKKSKNTNPESPEKASKRTKPATTTTPFFAARNQAADLPSSSIPSSSPAFGTPVHPLRPFALAAPTKAAILPILLPPATLRPLAFRTFTKKHSLTLTSPALQELASFIGRHCGSGWREEGLAEKVLEEVAKSWKNRNGGVIIEGGSPELTDILKNLEGSMSGGRVVIGGSRGSTLSRENSLILEPAQDADHYSKTRLGLRPTTTLLRDDSQMSTGTARPFDEDEPEDESLNDPRSWLRVIGAYEQPRLIYNTTKKHFERNAANPSILPPASRKTELFRNRFNVIHQRLLRNESFQSSAVAEAKARSSNRDRSGVQGYKITPIANLLGRHGSHHMLLGMLMVLPSGGLAISDLTGTIALDLSHAATIPEDSSWFTTGMIVLIDGAYEEEDDESTGKGLSGNSGVGGTIGGRFQGFFIGQPPCEKRKVTLGVSGPDGGPDHTIAAGFGWIDFLGVGSQRAVGPRMRKLEQRLLRSRPLLPDSDLPCRSRIVVLGELNLDQPRILQALRKILALYASEPEGSTPMTFVLAGNFASHAVMARGAGGGSIEYKEFFDALASTLSDFPSLLASSTFVFVPGDNDGWDSAFSAGAAVPLPRKSVPSLFTSRIRRAFAAANAEAGLQSGGGTGGGNGGAAAGAASETVKAPAGGEAIWTTNPGRLSLFGPTHEIVLFRDDISSRLRRGAVRLGQFRTHQSSQAEAADDAGAVQNEGHLPDESVDAMDLDSSAIVDTSGGQHGDKQPVSHDIHSARKLVKTLLDQGYLAPFRPSVRPVHWDLAGALHLYPLPTALVLVDPAAPPFCITYEGCHVMNPGPVLVPGRRGVGRWVEYEVGKVGRMRECVF